MTTPTERRILRVLRRCHGHRRLRAAMLTCTGPDTSLPAAYDQVYGVWLPASGKAPTDTSAAGSKGVSR